MINRPGLLVAGNWKMHGTRRGLADFLRELAADPSWQTFAAKAASGAAESPSGESPALAAALYLPATLVQDAVAAAGPDLVIGGQNLHQAAEGAFTGELSASHWTDVGARSVLIGHSERRQLFAETDEIVAQKLSAALAGGLQPVLCVGETLAERQAGAAEATVVAQLEAVRGSFKAQAPITVAYEPVWAIGTGETASPEQAQAMHAVIRRWLAALGADESTPLLYGGSVKADNAQSLFAQPDIDGGLIGGASLTAASFAAICRAALELQG